MIRLDRLRNSFSYAAQGWHFALKNDQNLRIHVPIAIIVLLSAFYFHLSSLEIAVLFVMVVLVIASELMNTAAEKIVDLITTEHRMEAKFAKDVSSAMVLTTAIGSVIVGLIIFIPHVFL